MNLAQHAAAAHAATNVTGGDRALAIFALIIMAVLTVCLVAAAWVPAPRKRGRR